MKRLLLLFLFLPVFANAQNTDTTIIRGVYYYPEIIRQITIIDTLEQTIFNHFYNDTDVHVNVPCTPGYKFPVKINGTTVGQAKCTCSGQIHFEVVVRRLAL